MELEKIRKILDRYNEGQCTAEETQLIEQWFENIHLQTTRTGSDIQADLAHVRQALNSRIQPVKVKKLRTWYYTAAAMAVLVVAGAWFFRQWQQSATDSSQPHLPLANATPHTSREVHKGYVIINTPKGLKEQVKLEDGSTILLNAGSRLRYPEHFAGSRNIYLEEGEAWFDAAPQPGNAFTVYSGNVSTTALGTTFNIRAYTTEHKITVALLTGKVKVTTSSQTPIILQPSEQASFDRRSLQLVKSTFKEENAMAWKKGNLAFKDATYDEIRTTIENRYQVTVVNQSSKKNWTYTGNFREESLQNVIETICLTEGLSYRIDKDTVFLKNQN
ncbi:FecR family protein [Chitinophaga tropicalis]|uniref:DUF4974 domain-containing protein n=1 Tax=Chitinophaga tropicalis TaxID=2683588 RepID=A0A7K1UBK6_9BACT|nr:FecR family protein [Chitinophaga tropicalis]MVT11771.1 DUF4974 domain-containing protein [Chitinophaga tropicalis]